MQTKPRSYGGHQPNLSYFIETNGLRKASKDIITLINYIRYVIPSKTLKQESFPLKFEDELARTLLVSFCHVHHASYGTLSGYG